MPGWGCCVRCARAGGSTSICYPHARNTNSRCPAADGASFRTVLGNFELRCALALRVDWDRPLLWLITKPTIMKHQAMKILVTTPTGKVGRRIVRELLAPDFSVRVVVRDPERLPKEIREQVEIICGPIDDEG